MTTMGNRLAAPFASHTASNNTTQYLSPILTMKTFQVIIEDDPEKTRWLYSDRDIADILRALAVSIVTAHTTGMKPAVQILVVRNEAPAAARH